MLSAEWPKTSCIGKRRKRERRKEKRKRKKRKKKKGKKEKKKKRKKKKERRKKRGVGEAIRNQEERKKKSTKQNKNKKQKQKQKNTGEYLPFLYTLSPLTSPGPGPSSWSSGGGACCADFPVLALGGAALPLPGAGLNGVVHPVRPREEATVAGAALGPWSQPPQ